MLPEISNQPRKSNQRISAAISSAAWRKFYDDKEEAKTEKQEGIRKRKLERKEMQEMKKMARNELQKLRKNAPKKKRRRILLK